MKRLLCILLAGMLLWAGALAEDEVYVCEHALKYSASISSLPEAQQPEAYAEEPELFGSAECRWCHAVFLVVKDLHVMEPEPCQPEACMHRFYQIPIDTKDGWYPSSHGLSSVYHEYRLWWIGLCIDCGQSYEMYLPGEQQMHQMGPEKGFHVDGQHIHATCQECLTCGYMIGELIPCIAFKDGSCEQDE